MSFESFEKRVFLAKKIEKVIEEYGHKMESDDLHCVSSLMNALMGTASISGCCTHAADCSRIWSKYGVKKEQL